MKNARTWVLLGLLLGIANSANAETVEELLAGAEHLFSVADFQGSLLLLDRAANETTETGLLGRIHLYRGLNHSVLDNREEAIRAFRAALIADPTLDLDAKQFKPELRLAFISTRESMEGQLEVLADQGGRVWVDGEERGDVPFEIRLPVGSHLVEVRPTSGRSAYSERVIVRFDEKVRVNAELELALSSTTTNEIPLPVQEESAFYQEWWFWTLIAAAATVAVAVPVALTRGGDNWVPDARDGRFDPSDGVQ